MRAAGLPALRRRRRRFAPLPHLSAPPRSGTRASPHATPHHPKLSRLLFAPHPGGRAPPLSHHHTTRPPPIEAASRLAVLRSAPARTPPPPPRRSAPALRSAANPLRRSPRRPPPRACKALRAVSELRRPSQRRLRKVVGIVSAEHQNLEAGDKAQHAPPLRCRGSAMPSPAAKERTNAE